MGNVANPRKVFNFKIEINGLPEFECQNVQIAELEIAATEHGDTNYDVKTPGKIKVGDITLEKLRSMPNSDLWAWNWLMAAQNPNTGGGQLPQNIKQLVVIRELDTTQTQVLNTWAYDGCWVKKLSQNKFDRMSSENILETVVLSADRPAKS